MRYVGIDFGTKRVGVALSDESGKFALPHSVISNSDTLVSEIAKICSDNNVRTIVVGESKDYSMKENSIMKKVRPFVEELKKQTNLLVVFEPEVLTSLEASHIQGEGKMLDASAAALILKSYLDRKRE